VTDAVVASAFVVVGEHLLCFVEPFGPLARVDVVADVRVDALYLLAVGVLDHRRRGVFGHAEQVVEVLCHDNVQCCVVYYYGRALL
jgi:hypothetical protein